MSGIYVVYYQAKVAGEVGPMFAWLLRRSPVGRQLVASWSLGGRQVVGGLSPDGLWVVARSLSGCRQVLASVLLASAANLVELPRALAALRAYDAREVVSGSSG